MRLKTKHGTEEHPQIAQIDELSTEAEALAEAYLAAEVVTPRYVGDARHVAIATVQGLAVIVSWGLRR